MLSPDGDPAATRASVTAAPPVQIKGTHTNARNVRVRSVRWAAKEVGEIANGTQKERLHHASVPSVKKHCSGQPYQEQYSITRLSLFPIPRVLLAVRWYRRLQGLS